MGGKSPARGALMQRRAPGEDRLLQLVDAGDAAGGQLEQADDSGRRVVACLGGAGARTWRQSVMEDA
jgi:hypothetical protein